MACIENALIVGGGIAGLSAAVALSRAGVHCDVVERSPERLGASLGLTGRVGEALVELGVYDTLHETSRLFAEDSTALSQRDAAGAIRNPGNVRPPAWPGAKEPLGVYRPALLDALGGTAESLGATIRVGVTTASIDDSGDAARVTFTDGTEGTYDLVVGADGIGSATRAAMFSDAPEPTYAGQMSIRFMAPGPAIDGEGWYHSAKGRIGFYHLPYQDIVYAPAVIDAAEPLRPSPEELDELFGSLLDAYTAPAVRELKERLGPESTLVCRPFESILVPPPWHRGHVLLIGDAAHATTAHMGQGGAMAIEDAVVLGQSIAAASTLPEALEAFTARRFPRVKTVVETSVELSRLEQQRAPVEENMAVLGTALRTLAEPY